MRTPHSVPYTKRSIIVIMALSKQRLELNVLKIFPITHRIEQCRGPKEVPVPVPRTVRGKGVADAVGAVGHRPAKGVPASAVFGADRSPILDQSEVVVRSSFSMHHNGGFHTTG